MTILDALLKTHSCSLNDENFRTLLAETEGIINSRPLIVETLSDVNGQISRTPSNLLTRKPMLFYHLLVTWIDQACNHHADGDKFNISLRNFGQLVEMNFFRAFRSDKNGIQKNKTLKLVT